MIMLSITLFDPFAIPSGPYAGALRYSAGGAVNWYFASTALLNAPSLPLAQTRSYLDAFIAHLDPYEGIADVLPTAIGTYAPIAPDSEDAYASTAISLAVRYYRETHDRGWFVQNVPALKQMAYAKLMQSVKPNGLIPASRTDATGYLMDNVENLVALRTFAAALREVGDRAANYVASFVDPLEAAIADLYDPRAGLYRWSDSDPIGPLQPYPACIAQTFPTLAGLNAHRDTVRLRLRGCRFEISRDPHETLRYALFLQSFRNLSSRERLTLEHSRTYRAREPDIITISLQARLAQSK